MTRDEIRDKYGEAIDRWHNRLAEEAQSKRVTLYSLRNGVLVDISGVVEGDTITLNANEGSYRFNEASLKHHGFHLTMEKALKTELCRISADLAEINNQRHGLLAQEKALEAHAKAHGVEL